MRPIRRAEALRVLASLLRAGYSLRVALGAWSERARAPELSRGARLARLGAPIDLVTTALKDAFEADVTHLELAIAVHGTLGGDMAATLDAIADAIEERTLAFGEARAQVAGARLSARLIALLPLAFLPLVSGSASTLLRPAGLVLALVGGGLVAGGLVWIGRLLPEPDPREADAALAAIVCGCLRSGTEVDAVLRALAETPSLGDGLRLAQRRVALGSPWSRALRDCADPSLRSLGVALRDVGLGMPLVEGIERSASGTRARAERAFKERVRTAPVKMVIPLTVCVLPAYVVLGIVPFLVGVAA